MRSLAQIIGKSARAHCREVVRVVHHTLFWPPCSSFQGYKSHACPMSCRDLTGLLARASELPCRSYQAPWGGYVHAYSKRFLGAQAGLPDWLWCVVLGNLGLNCLGQEGRARFSVLVMVCQALCWPSWRDFDGVSLHAGLHVGAYGGSVE